MTRRLIVPGNGLLRRQWLDGLRPRAESAGLGTGAIDRAAPGAAPRGHPMGEP